MAFGFYANNCLTGNVLQPELVSRAQCALPPTLTVPGLPRDLIPTFPHTLGAREWEARGRTQVLGPLPAFGWQLPADGSLGTAGSVNGLVVLSDGGGEGGRCRCGVASSARPATL